MKMLLGSLLALALVITSGPAKAELLKNVKAIGEVDLQTVSARNVSDFSTNRTAAGGTNNDRIGIAMTRVLAGLSWDLLDDVHARLTFRKNDRAWGNAGAAGQGAAAAGGMGSVGDQAVGGGGWQAATWVQEANVKIDKVFGHFDMTFGRQFFGEPGDLIVYYGPKNVYGLWVTAVDALAVSASNDWMTFQGVAGKTNSVNHGVAPANTDQDVRGIDIGWKGLPVKINTFIWNQVTHANLALGTPPGTVVGAAAGTAGGLNDNLYVYGLKLKGEAAGGWVSLVAALNGGTNRNEAAVPTALQSASANYDGKAILLDAGYKLDVGDIGGFTPWATWGWGSGRHDTTSRHNENFLSIASDFRPGVIYGRFNQAGQVNLGAGVSVGYDGIGGLGAAGLGNRQIWGGGLKYNVARQQKLTFGASFWDFNYQYATRAGKNPAAAMGNRHIGSEFDFQADWAHSENVLLSAGWATFQPGGFVKESIRFNNLTGGQPNSAQGNNPVNMLYADIGIKF